MKMLSVLFLGIAIGLGSGYSFFDSKEYGPVEIRMALVESNLSENSCDLLIANTILQTPKSESGMIDIKLQNLECYGDRKRVFSAQ